MPMPTPSIYPRKTSRVRAPADPSPTPLCVVRDRIYTISRTRRNAHRVSGDAGSQLRFELAIFDLTPGSEHFDLVMCGIRQGRGGEFLFATALSGFEAGGIS